MRERKNVFQMAKGYFTSIIDRSKDFMNSIKEAHNTRNRYNTPPLNKEEAEKLVANGFFIKMSETKDVYDENGNLVTDSVNQGTYNFANPNILDISLKMLYHTTYGVILLMTLHHLGKELQEHSLAMLMESEKCYLNLLFLWLSYFLLLSSQ